MFRCFGVIRCNSPVHFAFEVRENALLVSRVGRRADVERAAEVSTGLGQARGVRECEADEGERPPDAPWPAVPRRKLDTLGE